MALAGNIKEFGLADIFQIVSLQQKTGELIVEGSEGSVTILLEKGLIVAADSTARPLEERLQKALVRSGALSKFQLKRAIETQKKTLQPLPTVLAETGDVDRNTLQEILSRQIHETVYYLLRWTDGEYRFEPKKSVEYERQLITPVNTEFLVMEGFRITDEWSEFIEKMIPSLQLVVRRTSHSPPSTESLNDAESKVYNALTEEQTVQDIIDTCQLGEFDTCQTVCELMNKNLVESVQDKKSSAPKVRRVSIGISALLAKVVPLILGLAVVVGLVVLLLAIPKNFVPLYFPSIQGSDTVKRLVAQSELHHFSQILPQYFLASGDIPSSIQDLQATGFIAPDAIVEDPWGNAYRLNADGNQVVVQSAGGDGKPATDDDLQIIVPF
ncbi:DUF4388 domain-containing protein [candidate division KSB3 bacterium]|uniref:DUF4388 domain-containing protein n=1 Tax=candidate division KSB3 bacterium TaxID=2044937 RepID=A0A9D5JY38_9BACT|nr:DUF4388 domain-containing protein [candidate division KSB3 bacterium]MBD3326439.1 DUF4388 domain-containing protein [candidate division KSB3 bacterium]